MLWTLEVERLEEDLNEFLAQQLLENKPNLKLLHIQEWKVPIITYQVNVTSATKSRLDVLKKMIMILAQSKSDIQRKDIHQFLHVDDLFIQDIVEQMLNVNLLTELTTGELRLTRLGEEQLLAGTVLSAPEQEQFYFHHDTLGGTLLPDDPKNNWIKPEWDLTPYRYQDQELSLADKVLDSEGLREFLSETKQIFEVGGKEKIISSIDPLEQVNRKYAKVAEYHFYDILNDELFCKVWNGATSQWDNELEEDIEQNEKDQWREQYEIELAPHLTKRYEQLKKGLSVLEEQQTLSSKQTDLAVLRGSDIRKTFLGSFKETKEKMLMISPWISEQVIDRDMFNVLQTFAASGKTLYIAWGIAKRPELEDRAPAENLLDRLRSIRHDDGTPAVFVRWFGNQHNKEIVMDRSKLLLGSFNWLSYRGDYNLRNESVIMTPDKQVISETIEHIESKFITALEEELMNLLAVNEQHDLSSPEFDRIQVLNWMKELIILDSAFEKRKRLSNQLYQAVLEHGDLRLVHELAQLWLTYRKEDFGALNYLASLLDRQDMDRAHTYYSYALRMIPHSTIWQTHDSLSDHREWFDSFELPKETSTKPSKKKPKRKK